MDKRPELDTSIAVSDFEDFYWLKEELIRFSRSVGIPTTGSKMELSERISSFLISGNIPIRKKSKQVTSSKFDWNRAHLTKETLITDNYHNSENVRSFFLKEISSSFKFNVKFMRWIKDNVGKNLGDAIAEWHRLNQRAKGNSENTEIAPQFEYNRYLRDFLKDNPSLSRIEGIKLWKIKKTKRGDRSYSSADLQWLATK